MLLPYRIAIPPTALQLASYLLACQLLHSPYYNTCIKNKCLALKGGIRRYKAYYKLHLHCYGSSMLYLPAHVALCHITARLA
jgi:hypothetical protein